MPAFPREGLQDPGSGQGGSGELCALERQEPRVAVSLNTVPGTRMIQPGQVEPGGWKGSLPSGRSHGVQS